MKILRAFSMSRRESETRRHDRRRLRCAPRLEGLEPRRLLSLSVAEYPIPTANSQPRGLTAGPDGSLWFVEGNADRIGELNPTTHVITEFPLPKGYVAPIALNAEPDGNIWYTVGSTMYKMDPQTHLITPFPNAAPNTSPGGIESTKMEAAPDGNLWLTGSDGTLTSFNPTTHVSATYKPALAPDVLGDFTIGPDGNIWYTNGAEHEIGEFDIATHKSASYAVPGNLTSLDGIATGADGKLWFTGGFVAGASLKGYLFQFDPSTHVFKTFVDPDGISTPFRIWAGPDGDLWLTNMFGSSDKISIQRFDPTNGAFTVPVPNLTLDDAADLDVNYYGITFGSDGNLYFTDVAANKIGAVELQQSVAMPTNTVLTATANPSVASNPVTFTAVVSPQSGGSLPTGSVVFTIDGTAQPAVGLTVSKGQATATFTTSTLGPGQHLVTATYAPQGNFGASSSNTVVENVSVPVKVKKTGAADGPEVISVISQGYRKRRPTVLLTFNEALDPATARDVSAYHIMNRRGRALRIVSASYDAASHSVSIRPAQSLNRHETYTLIVGGTGVTALKSATDVALDGEQTGYPGSDFVTRLR